MPIEPLDHLGAQNFSGVNLMEDVDRHVVLDDFIGDPFEGAEFSPASVKDQHPNIQTFKWVTNYLLVLADLGHFCEVCHDVHCLDSRRLLFNLLQFVFHLLFISGDNANVELVVFGAFHGHFEANAVGSTCDYGPRLLGLCL